ncbi:hypothetical protein CCH79_00012583 [Gambusia affinis]|uniref:DNA polymerase alpha subunit B n=1 Tax=Gambusia affinis TaxID=33528 RepID=A0A315VHK1_GAMAF|nr:hypothetical protein CCH79_00012583 [Gambusia affinis]
MRCCSGTSSDRFSRILNHMLTQRSYYPLYPPAEEVNMDYEKFQIHGQMLVTPDILVVPSELRYFVKDVAGCVCVNPGRLTKGQVGGTYGRLLIQRSAAPEDGKRESPCLTAQVTDDAVLRVSCFFTPGNLIVALLIVFLNITALFTFHLLLSLFISTALVFLSFFFILFFCDALLGALSVCSSSSLLLSSSASFSDGGDPVLTPWPRSDLLLVVLPSTEEQFVSESRATAQEAATTSLEVLDVLIRDDLSDSEDEASVLPFFSLFFFSLLVKLESLPLSLLSTFSLYNSRNTRRWRVMGVELTCRSHSDPIRAGVTVAFRRAADSFRSDPQLTVI